MISSIKHKQRISWTFLNDTMAFSANEMPKNHNDKEHFAAALSCIQTGILTLLFPLKRRRSSPSPFISDRVLEAVASWILKSLIYCIVKLNFLLGNKACFCGRFCCGGVCLYPATDDMKPWWSGEGVDNTAGKAVLDTVKTRV